MSDLIGILISFVETVRGVIYFFEKLLGLKK